MREIETKNHYQYVWGDRINRIEGTINVNHRHARWQRPKFRNMPNIKERHPNGSPKTTAKSSTWQKIWRQKKKQTRPTTHKISHADTIEFVPQQPETGSPGIVEESPATADRTNRSQIYSKRPVTDVFLNNNISTAKFARIDWNVDSTFVRGQKYPSDCNNRRCHDQWISSEKDTTG